MRPVCAIASKSDVTPNGRGLQLIEHGARRGSERRESVSSLSKAKSPI
jgi:hypothetical protein